MIEAATLGDKCSSKRDHLPAEELAIGFHGSNYRKLLRIAQKYDPNPISTPTLLSAARRGARTATTTDFAAPKYLGTT